MRIQKGKIHFTKKDTWNLDHVLSDIILAGLQKFKETNRHGYPNLVLSDYLDQCTTLSEEDKKSAFMYGDATKFGIKEQDVIKYWETILDDMMFSFKYKEHKEYYQIEKSLTVSNLCEPIKFTKEELEDAVYIDEKFGKTTKFIIKPKDGYTQQDVDQYNIRMKEYYDQLEKRKAKGLQLFAKYFYSLWD